MSSCLVRHQTRGGIEETIPDVLFQSTALATEHKSDSELEFLLYTCPMFGQVRDTSKAGERQE